MLDWKAPGQGLWPLEATSFSGRQTRIQLLLILGNRRRTYVERRSWEGWQGHSSYPQPLAQCRAHNELHTCQWREGDRQRWKKGGGRERREGNQQKCRTSHPCHSAGCCQLISYSTGGILRSLEEIFWGKQLMHQPHLAYNTFMIITIWGQQVIICPVFNCPPTPRGSAEKRLTEFAFAESTSSMPI